MDVEKPVSYVPVAGVRKSCSSWGRGCDAGSGPATYWPRELKKWLEAGPPKLSFNKDEDAA